MKKTQMSSNIKRAMDTLKNAPKANGRILNASEIMERSLALTEMAEKAERSVQAGKSSGRRAPRPLNVNQPELVAV